MIVQAQHAVHHLAWRVDDEPHQLAVRDRVARAGRRPTPVIDRFWFKSIYFLEPGGVLFVFATDAPGFGVDEDPQRLGEALVLPPWLDVQRAAIQSMLPPLTYPPQSRRLARTTVQCAANGLQRLPTPRSARKAAAPARCRRHTLPPVADLERPPIDGCRPE